MYIVSDLSDASFFFVALIRPGSIPPPVELVVVPLSRRPVFPGIVAPILIQDPEVVKTLTSNSGGGIKYVGLFLVNEQEQRLQEQHQPDNDGTKKQSTPGEPETAAPTNANSATTIDVDAKTDTAKAVS